MEDPASSVMSFSPSTASYVEKIQGPKFPRTNNYWECSLIDTLVK